jgi:lipid II:glycine glycyltransferase (peptidoglycan interpeptide bridge formation enzyme)
MDILICTYEHEPIAGTVITQIGPTGLCLLAAADEKGRALGGAYQLQWRAIELLKAKGVRWYDLGGINPEQNPGCYRFKSGLGGKIGSEFNYVGQFEGCRRFTSALTIRSADYLRNVARRMTVLGVNARRILRTAVVSGELL